VGNEFSSVEALWSQFENVMAKEQPEGGHVKAEEERGEGGDDGHDVKNENDA
jgi:DASH complex subunit DAD1